MMNEIRELAVHSWVTDVVYGSGKPNHLRQYVYHYAFPHLWHGIGETLRLRHDVLLYQVVFYDLALCVLIAEDHQPNG